MKQKHRHIVKGIVSVVLTIFIVIGSISLLPNDKKVKAGDDFIYTAYAALAGTEGFKNGENCVGLVDNRKSTKWCCSFKNSVYIEFKSAEPIIPLGYVLTTGNDTADNNGARNPRSWTIKAKENVSDAEWITIASVTNDNVLQAQNTKDYEFTINNNTYTAYQYFRFEITAIKSGDVFQLAELQFKVSSPMESLPELGIGKIGNPKVPDSEDDPWTGSYVYFGKDYIWNEENPDEDIIKPIKYRVLDRSTSRFNTDEENENSVKKMLLDCDYIFDNMMFAHQGFNNDWVNSDIKAFLNGDSFLNNTKYFTVTEKNTIAGSSVESHELVNEWDENPNKYTVVDNEIKQLYGNYVALSGEKVFILDAEDVSNNAYGYDTHTSSKSRVKKDIYDENESVWWLRSAKLGVNDYAGIVEEDASLTSCKVDWRMGVSPAFNINLSSVILSSLIKLSENSKEAEYKLTVLDRGMSMGLSNDCATDSNNIIIIPYKIGVDSSLTSSHPNRVSVVVTDGTWTENGWNEGANILQYAKIADISSADAEIAGVGRFSLDNSITGTLGEDYHVYILAEDVNGLYETDYATAPFEITSANAVFYTAYTATTGKAGFSDAESYVKLVDNDKTTKWCCTFDSSNTYIEFQSEVPIAPIGYMLTTANDSADNSGARNPKGWVIKAKADPSDDWTEIAVVTNDTVLQAANNTDYEFAIENSAGTKYQYFRFEVSTITSGDVFQLAEFQLKYLCDDTNLTYGSVNGLEKYYEYEYGSDIIISYTVKDFNDTVLVKGMDFDASITNSNGIEVTNVTDKGTYTLTITAKEGSGYNGSLTKNFIVAALKELGIGKIQNPKVPESGQDPWTGNYIYFGKYDGNPVKYRVLSNDTTDFSKERSDGEKPHTMFLDCDNVLFKKYFSSWTNVWLKSEIYMLLNDEGDDDSFINKGFTKTERNTIAQSFISGHGREDEGTPDIQSEINKSFYPYVALTGEKIFLLDIEDLSNPKYGYHKDNGGNHTKAYSQSSIFGEWWLRSGYSGYGNEYVGGVGEYGALNHYLYYWGEGISPAFNIDLSSVIFSSLIKANENSPEAGAYGAEYKLTIKDRGMCIRLTDEGATILDNEISVPYKIKIDRSLTSLSPEYVSVVVTDGTWTKNGWSKGAKILQYAKVAEITSTDTEIIGIVNFSLDSSIIGTLGEDYHVYILAEDVNGAYETDYATAPVDITGTFIPDVTIGDVDGDGEITPKDVTILRRHLAGGWNVTVDMEAADVDGDKEVTPKDVTILRRFLAGGWGIKLGE